MHVISVHVWNLAAHRHKDGRSQIRFELDIYSENVPERASTPMALMPLR
jgi:hypothetical protein